MTEETALVVGLLFKNFLPSNDVSLMELSSFLRLKVEVDLNLSMRRGALLNLAELGKVWIQFQYEKLPNFCYICGKLGHVQAECDDDEARGFDNKYGPWLRAPPLVSIYSSTTSDRLFDDSVPIEREKGGRCLLNSILLGDVKGSGVEFFHDPSITHSAPEVDSMSGQVEQLAMEGDDVVLGYPIADPKV